jgi:hypothetical protein
LRSFASHFSVLVQPTLRTSTQSSADDLVYLACQIRFFDTGPLMRVRVQQKEYERRAGTVVGAIVAYTRHCATQLIPWPRWMRFKMSTTSEARCRPGSRVLWSADEPCSNTFGATRTCKDSAYYRSITPRMGSHSALTLEKAFSHLQRNHKQAEPARRPPVALVPDQKYLKGLFERTPAFTSLTRNATFSCCTFSTPPYVLYLSR